MSIILDSEYAGIGDIVALAWICEGLRAEGHDSAFSQGRHRQLAELLGQPVTTEPPRVHVWTTKNPLGLYDHELRCPIPIPKPNLWQLWMPAAATPRRPRHAIGPEAMDWAADIRGRFLQANDRPLAVLFPSTAGAWPTRTWGTGKWTRVAERLIAAGWAVVAMDPGKQQVERLPAFIYGMSIERVAALILAADCVVSNDSGCAHLAGTLGTKTFAVMGPTDPTIVYGYVPEVECLRASPAVAPCVGCHFQGHRGFSWTCDSGCEAMALLPADGVADRVIGWEAERRAA